MGFGVLVPLLLALPSWPYLVVAEGEELAAGGERQAVIFACGDLGHRAAAPGSETSPGVGFGVVVPLFVGRPSWPL